MVVLFIFHPFWGIDQSLMESASLDGTSKIQKIRYILPCPFKADNDYFDSKLLGTYVRRILDFLPSSSGFRPNYGMLQNTIDTFVYRALLTQNNVGMSAAASFFQSVVGFSFILIFNGITQSQ